MNNQQQQTPWYHYQPSPLEQEMKTHLQHQGVLSSGIETNTNPYHYDSTPSGPFDKGLSAAGFTFGAVGTAELLKAKPGSYAAKWAQTATTKNNLKTLSFLNSASTASEAFLRHVNTLGNSVSGLASKLFRGVAQTGLGKSIGALAQKTGVQAIGAKVLGFGARGLAFIGVTTPVGWAIGAVALATTLAFMIL